MMKIPQEYKKDYYWLIKDKYNRRKPQAGKRVVEFERDVKRLLEDEPLDYIIGWKPFLNCKIDLSFKPHAPVPETEFWAEKFIKAMKNEKILLLERSGAESKGSTQTKFCPSTGSGNKIFPKIKILDVFSGSGAIGISVLKALRNAQVDFAEFEPRLIKQIKYNLKINRISPNRYRVIRADVLNPSTCASPKASARRASSGNKFNKYDYILANPPYVPAKRKPKMKSWAIKYWPQEALFGGQDGLFFIRKFLKQAKNRLAKGGSIWMEFDSSQKKEIEKLIKQNKYSSHSFHRDQYKRWRYVIINL